MQYGYGERKLPVFFLTIITGVHMIAPELFIGYVVGVAFIGLFIIVRFIADMLDRRDR